MESQENVDKQHDFDKRLSFIEKRISRIESALGIEEIDIDQFEKNVLADGELPINKTEDVERSIGEYGLAWLGSIVLIFGIVFLSNYLLFLGKTVMASLIGSVSAVVIYLVGIKLRKNFRNLGNLFEYSSYLLFYYFILTTHFYNPDPLVSNKLLVVILLLLLNVFVFYQYALTNKLPLLIMSQVVLLFTAFVSNYSLLFSIAVLLISVKAVIDFRKTENYKLLIYSLFLIYICLLQWVLGNPIANGSVAFQEYGKYVLAILFIIGGAFSSILFPINESSYTKNDNYLGVVLLNAFLFTVILTFYIIAFFSQHYLWIFLTVFVICLSYAILLKIKTKWDKIPSIYAVYSFMAFSAAVYGHFSFTWAIFLLAVQSLLVVSVSLWFKAKLIVILNLILFLLILMAGFLGSIESNIVYFAFPFIALLSARIINWQKGRLEIKTELLRNIYLFVLVTMLMYALYKNVPSQFVTLSWTIAAVSYFIMSIFLNNVKYRYLAIVTFIATVFYLFIVDLSTIDLVYRIIAFLFLSMILFFVSVYYTRNRNKKSSNSN